MTWDEVINFNSEDQTPTTDRLTVIESCAFPKTMVDGKLVSDVTRKWTMWVE